jgi:NAD dependent epimerase/dehydratase family enzyme
MPWIALDDMVRLIVTTIANPAFTGPVNATAPEPVRNATFAHELGRALHRPALLRLPAAPLRWLAGDMAEELLLTGRRVVPEKALRNGFVFRHPNLRSALTAILGGAAAGNDLPHAMPHLPAPAAKK